MKKLLFIALGSRLWLCAGAQSANSQAVSLRPYWLNNMMHRNEPAGDKAVTNISFYKQGTQSRNNEGRNARVLATGTVIGTSFNAFGIYDAATTAVTATQKTSPEMICMTHRECKGFAYGSGAYSPSFSLNGGNTWDSTDFVLFRNQTSRYPNGVIFNPAGNTNPMQAYLAAAGPWTNGSASQISWVKTVYGSMRFDTANRNENILVNGNVGVVTQNTGLLAYMTSCDDSNVHIIGVDWNENAAQTAFTRFMGAVLTTGKFNGTNFTWTQQVIRPHLWDGFKGATAGSPYDSLGEFMGIPGTAWSQDGATGYVVIFGNLDSANMNFASYQPIVYKTTNHGQTWAMMTPYNYRHIAGMMRYLKPTADSGVPFPIWNLLGQAQGDENDYDMVVDMNGNLHIVGSITSAVYGNPDSSYAIYTYNYPSYYIYDVYTTNPSGGWQARFVDSMTCRPSYSVTTGTPWLSNGTNQVSYGARIQTSRTPAGDKIFYTWNDDLFSGDSTGMLYPDIKGRAYDVQHNAYTYIQTFTNTADQYFICVSDIALVSGTYPNSIDSIPVVYIASSNNNDGTSPIEYRYQGAVVYRDSLPLEVDKPIGPGFSVSNNYPNPFANTTQFNINLDKESNVAVDVYNMLGEKIESIAPAKMAAGTHVVTLGGKGMNTGVYFYRVTVNDESVTRKMMVQQ